MHIETKRNDNRYVAIALITTILVSLISKFYFHKHLSLDGVGVFLHILENESFINVSGGRLFSEYLTEWPLVFSVRMGISHIPLLINIFGFGLILPYIISFSVCLYAIREGRWSMMFFPIASYIAINMTGDYLLSGEHHVMVLFAWPILFLLLIDRPLIWKEAIVFWALVAIFSRSYETALVPNLIILCLLILRLRRFNDGQQKVIIGIGVMLVLIGIIYSLVFIFVPRSLVNRSAFLDSIPRILKIKEVLCYMGFLVLFLCGWIINGKNRLQKCALYVIAVVPIIYYVYIRGTTDYAITSYWSFSSRTLSGLLLPGMMLVAIIVYYVRWANNRAGIYVFGVACFVMVGFNLKDLSNWLYVKKQMESILTSESGDQYISIENTVLKDSHFRWSWNNPSLSLVWSYPCVRTIITNGDDVEWEPFDAKKQVMLKRYLRYNSSFAQIDPDVVGCE